MTGSKKSRNALAACLLNWLFNARPRYFLRQNARCRPRNLDPEKNLFSDQSYPSYEMIHELRWQLCMGRNCQECRSSRGQLSCYVQQLTKTCCKTRSDTVWETEVWETEEGIRNLRECLTSSSAQHKTVRIFCNFAEFMSWNCLALGKLNRKVDV